MTSARFTLPLFLLLAGCELIGGKDDTSEPDCVVSQEVCDGVDNDCDGVADNGVTSTFYADADSDGFGDAAQPTEACEAPTGYVSDSTDCDDGDADISPDGAEVCDGADNDCDGLIDDADDSVDASTYSTWYADEDGDGYGDGAAEVRACAAPEGTVDNQLDCDDTTGDISPDAVEICDSVDNDCDGFYDDADDSVDVSTGSNWYADDDRDGYGDAADVVMACSNPDTRVTDATDCDDANPDANPAATEVCDGVDNDCDTLTDDADPSLDTSTTTTWYNDDDADGYGNANDAVELCLQPQGFVTDDTDCDDNDASVSPAETEVCFDGIDNNCDTQVDEGCSTCGDGVLDPGEEVDPPVSPFASVTVDPVTCRWDFSQVQQLYCNGTCTWAGGSGCDQADADIACKLITGDPTSTAISWTSTTALATFGFTCPRTSLGTQIFVDRGVSAPVFFTDNNILSTHGAGQIIAYPVCN